MTKAAWTIAFIAATLGLMWIWAGVSDAGAQAGNAEFSIGVSGVPGCDTTNGDASCDLSPDSAFGVEVSLDSLTASVTDYTGFDIMFGYEGVVPEGDPSANAWPQCSFAAVSPPRPEGDRLLFGCAAGFPPNDSSTYTGIVGVATFRCDESGVIRLLHGETDTNVSSLLNNGEFVQSWDSGSDELTINCVSGGMEPVLPTQVPPPAGAGATPPAVTPGSGEVTETAATQPTGQRPTLTPSPTSDQGSSVGDDDDGGVSTGVVIGIVIAAIAAAGVLGLAGWRYAQGRQGTGGGSP